MRRWDANQSACVPLRWDPSEAGKGMEWALGLAPLSALGVAGGGVAEEEAEARAASPWEPPAAAGFGPAPHGYFTNRQGLQLAYYAWLPGPRDPPLRACCVAVHGYGVSVAHEFLRPHARGRPHAAVEGSWVDWFNRRGVAVVAYDHQSHGHSASAVPGVRCYFERFADLSYDLAQFCADVVPGLLPAGGAGAAHVPVFPLGMSMGGGVVVDALLRFRNTLGASAPLAVLLSPMLSLERAANTGANRYLRHVVSALSRATPTLPVGAKTANPFYPDLQREFEADPGNYQGLCRARVAHEFLAFSRTFEKRARHFDHPFLVIASKRDVLVDPESSAMFARATKTRPEHKRAHLLDDFCHSLCLEPGNEDIFHLVMAWLDERLPAQPPPLPAPSSSAIPLARPKTDRAIRYQYQGEHEGNVLGEGRWPAGIALPPAAG